MIRRPVHALLSALALALAATALSLLLATCEHYPSDLDELEAPSLTGFAVTPDSVDVTHDPGRVTASVSVRSPGGADSAVVVVASPSGAEQLLCSTRGPVSGDRQNGRWECAVTLAPGHETGVWHAARVEVFHGGAVLRLVGEDLRSANFNIGVRVAQSLPPTVGIVAPAGDATFIAGDTIHFAGRGTSFLGAPLSGGALVWTSSIDGEIGRGEHFASAALSEGSHTITLTATDARGLSSAASVRLVVNERIVVASIQITPEAAELSALGEAVRFTARAFDTRGREVRDLAFEWTSLNPAVATIDATGTATARAYGTALIRARAADVVGTASLTVDAPPTVGIIAPANDASFVEGDEIRFEGWATRMDGEALPDSALRWVSDRDGTIGAGRSLRAPLSLGSHIITLTATTEYGLSSTAHTRIRVEEPRTGVASIRIDPAVAGVTGTEATLRFTARAFDSADREMPDAVFEWSSDDPAVATVDAQGLVTAVGLGATRIRARSGDVEAAADFAVGTPSLRIESPAYGASFTVGDTITFQGSATSRDGTPLTGGALVWSSSSGTLGTGQSFRAAALPVGTHSITLTATDRYGLVSVDVVSIDVRPRSESEISFITILPEAAGVEMGDTVHLTATAHDATGAEIPGVVFTWSSSDPETATVDADGVVTGHTPGEAAAVITAAVGDVYASVHVEVYPPEGLPWVEITAPADGAVVVAGDTLHLTGEGIGSDGAAIDPDEMLWRSDLDGFLGGGSPLSIATLSVGEHEITLVGRDVFGRTAMAYLSLTVQEAPGTEPGVVTVSVYPLSAPSGGVLPLGQTLPFVARAMDADWNDVLDVLFTWTSSDPAIATVDTEGVVTGRAAGSVTIGAAVGGVSGSWTLDVGGAPVVEITAPADGMSFLLGDSITFDATVAHSAWIPDSATVWMSSIDGVLDYYHPFTTAALSVGSHVITLTATDQYGVSGADTIRIEVRALSAVQRIEITPAEAGLAAPGDSLRFTGRAFDELDQEMPGIDFTWTSRGGDTAPVATIDAEGWATARTTGLAVIEASVGDVRAEALLAVGAPSIGITAPQRFQPDAPPPNWGDAITFVGWGVSTADEALTGAALAWRSSIDGPIGTGESFTTTTLSAGLHEITLTGTDRFGLSGTAHIDTLLVFPANLHDVEITPPVAFLARIGDAAQLSARTWTRDPVPVEVPGVNFQWLSSDTAVVSIDANGLATARGWGEAHITAITNTGLGTSIAWVGTPDFDYIRIIPLKDFTLDAPGDTLRLEARGYRTTGEVGQIINNLPVTWTSSDPAVVTVDAHGLVTAHAPGSATIHAALGDLSATVGTVVEEPVPPIVYIVAPSDEETFALGDSIHFEGWARDGRTELPLPASALVWTSSIDGEIGVGESFTTTTLSVGVHIITLTATTEQGASTMFSVTIEVVGSGIAFIQIDPYEAEFSAIGDTVRFTARALDSFESEITGVTFTWTSSDPAVVSIDAQGLATAQGYGAASITATVGSVSGSAGGRVLAPVAWQSLHTGPGGSCGLTAEGVAYCWGHNINGKLGDGESTVGSVPRPVRVAGGLTFETIAVANNHMVGLTPDGKAYAWGGNDYGQLGDGTTTERRTPVPVAGGLTFTAISAYAEHTVALTTDGTAYAWGRNDYGQLGDSTIIVRHAPVRVATELTFAAIDAGASHTVALTADGRAYTWGHNGNGRLGTGTTTGTPTPVPAPVPVVGGHTFAAVSAGSTFTLGLTAGGVAYGWGFNVYGQLGDSTQVQRLSPQPLASNTSFVAVSAGQSFGMALDKEGNAYAWGENQFGKLGDGTTTNRLAPVPVAGGHRFASVAATSTFAAGLTADGTAYGWGSNAAGQLGTGTYINSEVPIPAVTLYR